MSSKKKETARVWAVLRVYSKAALRYPGLLSALFLGAITIEVAGVVSPLYLRQFINLLSSGTPSAEVAQALFSILFIFAAINFVGWLGQRIRMLIVGRFEARVMSDLYQSAFAYLIGHSHEFFISNFTGTLTRRVTRYAHSFEQILDNLVFNFFSASVFA